MKSWRYVHCRLQLRSSAADTKMHYGCCGVQELKSGAPAPVRLNSSNKKEGGYLFGADTPGRFVGSVGPSASRRP